MKTIRTGYLKELVGSRESGVGSPKSEVIVLLPSSVFRLPSSVLSIISGLS